MDTTKDNIRDRSTNTCVQVVKMFDIKLILLNDKSSCVQMDAGRKSVFV